MQAPRTPGFLASGYPLLLAALAGGALVDHLHAGAVRRGGNPAQMRVSDALLFACLGQREATR